MPSREGGKVYANLGGVITELEPVEASLIAEEWFRVMKGVFVFETTKIS